MPTFWGGPPTIADLAGDSTPEILVVTATQLIAYRSNLSTLWRRGILTDFGGFHGASAFDLDGDGTREVFVLADTVGRDATRFFILDGATGRPSASTATLRPRACTCSATPAGRERAASGTSCPRSRV